MNWARIFPLALGTFAIGTDNFIVAGVLPLMAEDLRISLALAGIQATVFSLVYAFGAPVLASLTERLERKTVLLTSMGLFAAANVATALVPDFVSLLVMRAFAAAAAAVFSPIAAAMAAELSHERHRGKAISVVTGGLTVSLVLGVPIGAVIGEWANWRAGFGFVAALGVFCVIGMVMALPKLEGSFAGPRFLERFRPARQADVALALTQSLVIIGSTFVTFTYLAGIIYELDVVGRNLPAAFLLVYGVAAIAGNMLGGRLADRIGALATTKRVVAVLAASLAALSLAAWLAPGPAALITAGVAVAVWGMSGWAFTPAQFSRLAQMCPTQMPMAFALNTSAIYIGAAVGAAVGSIVVSSLSVADLGWVAAAGVLIGLALLHLSGGPVVSAPPLHHDTRVAGPGAMAKKTV